MNIVLRSPVYVLGTHVALGASLDSLFIAGSLHFTSLTTFDRPEPIIFSTTTTISTTNTQIHTKEKAAKTTPITTRHEMGVCVCVFVCTDFGFDID